MTARMTEGPIGRTLLAFSVPLLLTNLFQQLYTTVDAAVVGRFVGEEALAAVGSCGLLTSFLIYFFLGLSVGASIVVGHRFGAREEDAVRRGVSTAFALAIWSGLALTAIGLAGAPQFLSWMNVPDAAMGLAVSYLRTSFLGMVPLMLYNMLSGLLRAVGDSRTPLACLLVSGVLNIALDLWFVAGLHWGVFGAALATVLAQGVSAILVLFRLRRRTDCCRLHLSLVPERDSLRRIVQVGVPAGLQSVLVCFANVVVQSQINRFGLEVMAGFTAYMKLDGFLYMPIDAFCHGMTSFTAQNLGAGRRDRILRGTAVCLGLSAGVTVCIAAVLLALDTRALGVFTTAAGALAHGSDMLHVLAPLYVLYAVNQTLTGVIRGTGCALPPMGISLVCMCGLRVSWILLLGRLWPSPYVIYTSYPVTWLVTCAALVVCYAAVVLRPRKEKTWSSSSCSIS